MAGKPLSRKTLTSILKDRSVQLQQPLSDPPARSCLCQETGSSTAVSGALWALSRHWRFPLPCRPVPVPFIHSYLHASLEGSTAVQGLSPHFPVSQ